ncbi:MAG TPA: GNAT family N-acetyltransferase, partial [Gaiellaceae bacterium]
AVRAGDAVLAVLRRPAALLGQAARSRMIRTELGELEAFRSLIGGWNGGRLAEPAAEQALDEIDAFFVDEEVSYGITITPDVVPPELTTWLGAHGFSRGYAWTKFRRGIEPAATPETDLSVERIGADRGDVFADVFQRAYGTPELLRPRLEQIPGETGWYCFVAFAKGVPAATAAVFVTRDVGWFGMAGTLPEFRRRGAQTVLLAARIAAAREAGCSVVVTETGEPVEGRPSNSYRNIVRAGFDPAYVRRNYLSSAKADTSGTRA